jgi:hypothetical protein
MFVSHELRLDVSFEAARARLVNLTHADRLSAASDGAYADGLTGLIRVGPFGDVLGASKLVRVSMLEPVPRRRCREADAALAGDRRHGQAVSGAGG